LQDKEALESLGLITSHGYYSGNYGRWSGNIYTAKVNAIIPWAGIQRPPHWVGGDPNPGSAFTDSEDGTYKVRPGYYFYKQITRAGQPGMKVAEASAMDSETAVIAFASNSTLNPDAFIVTNINTSDQKIAVTVLGTQATSFEAYSTTKAPGSGLDDTQEVSKKFEHELRQFIDHVDEIKTSHIGTPADTDRDVIDNTWSYSLVLSFDSKKEQDIYQGHQAHLKFIENASSLWEKVLVYDSIKI
jgi:hypothetical protein